MQKKLTENCDLELLIQVSARIDTVIEIIYRIYFRVIIKPKKKLFWFDDPEIDS